MENNEVMDNVVNENDIILDLVEEAEEKNYSSLKNIVTIGAIGVAGALAYKYIVKPVAAKVKTKVIERKANKEAKDNIVEFTIHNDDDVDNLDE